MAEFDEEAIKAALAAHRKSRRPYTDILNRPQLQPSAVLSKQRRFTESRLTKLLDDAGLGQDKLRDLRHQSEIELRRLAETQAVAIAKRSASVSKSIRASLETWRRSVEQRAPVVAAGVPPVFMSEPQWILSVSGDVSINSRTLSPWGSVAKVTGEWSTPPSGLFGVSDVTFVFIWRNPRDVYVLLDIYSSLGLNGFSGAYASGSFWSDNWADVAGHVFLDPFLFTESGSSYPYQSTNYVEVMDYRVNGGDLLGFGNYGKQAVSGTYSLSYPQFILPPRATAIFGVQFYVGAWMDDGWYRIDFTRGDFEVVCPGLVLQILS